MMNENSVIDRKVQEKLNEKKEKDGFTAGGMRIHGLTKREYNTFVSHIRAAIGDDEFWNAFICAAK